MDSIGVEQLLNAIDRLISAQVALKLCPPHYEVQWARLASEVESARDGLREELDKLTHGDKS
jgi:hypothetical protein